MNEWVVGLYTELSQSLQVDEGDPVVWGGFPIKARGDQMVVNSMRTYENSVREKVVWNKITDCVN